MGKQLSKADLHAEIAVEKGKLDELISKLNDQMMTESGVTPGGWSVKDILAHLIAWQQMNLSWYASGKRGETPVVPADGISWRETPKLNQRIFDEYKDRGLEEIRSKFNESHRQMLEMVDLVPDDEFVKVGHFNWAGPSWCLSDYARANTASHYRWAGNHIRRWLKRRTAA